MRTAPGFEAMTPRRLPARASPSGMRSCPSRSRPRSPPSQCGRRFRSRLAGLPTEHGVYQRAVLNVLGADVPFPFEFSPGSLPNTYGERTARAIRDAGNEAIFHPTDVSDEEPWAAAVDVVRSAYGPVSALVSDAYAVRVAPRPRHHTRSMEPATRRHADGRLPRLPCLLGRSACHSRPPSGLGSDGRRKQGQVIIGTGLRRRQPVRVGTGIESRRPTVLGRTRRGNRSPRKDQA